MQHLRQALAPFASRLGIADVDLAALTSHHRQFTQSIARYIHGQRCIETNRPQFAGIRCLSRLNPGWRCWAAFDDRVRLGPGSVTGPPNGIASDDVDLRGVAAIFGLGIE